MDLIQNGEIEMTKDRKIVFFDIDGTIYMYNKGIPKDTIQAIKQLRENGHIAVICTGRTKSIVFSEILNIGFDGIIAGAGTYAEYNGEEIYRYVLDKDLLNETVDAMKKHNIMAIAEGIECVCFDLERMPEKYKSVYDIYIETPGNHIGNIEDIDEISASKLSGAAINVSDMRDFKKEYADRFTLVNHDEDYVEMIPKGYSKAYGIEKMIKYLDIPWENTYAFGDSMNDYEMLKYVNYGVAMGNASKKFKKEMKYTTEDYDKGGIKNALERFGLI